MIVFIFELELFLRVQDRVDVLAVFKPLLLCHCYLFILVVDEVDNIGPGTLFAVDTLGLAVALASVDFGKVLRGNGGQQFFRPRFTRDQDLACGVR